MITLITNKIVSISKDDEVLIKCLASGKSLGESILICLKSLNKHPKLDDVEMQMKRHCILVYLERGNMYVPN